MQAESNEDLEIFLEEDELFTFYDLEAWDHAPLAQIVLVVAKTLAERESYCPNGLAADPFGKPVELSSKQATRWSFSGMLSKAATDLFDPPDEKLEKDLKSKYDFKVKKAKKIKGLREWKARRYYGYAWGLYNHASEEVTKNPLWWPKNHDDALRVIEFARREMHRLLGVDDGSVILGMARRTDLKSIAEIELLDKIDAEGADGYRLQDGNIREILACYDLYRRGVIVETDAPWTYRRKHMKILASLVLSG